MAQMQVQQPKQHGLFHKNVVQQPDIGAFQEDLGNIERRLRILEENITNIRRAVQVTEQNMLGRHKSFGTEVRTLTSDIGDLKKNISEIREKMFEIIKELEESAKRDEVKVLEKYINFWNPVNFVTHNEVDEIVKEIIKKNTKK